MSVNLFRRFIFNGLSPFVRQYSILRQPERSFFQDFRFSPHRNCGRIFYCTSTKILPQSSSTENSTETTTEQEIRDPRILLDLVKQKLHDGGTELIIPDVFEENLENSQLALLLKECPGLKMNYLADAFALRPKFLEISSSRWSAMLKTFRDAEITPGIALAALVGHPAIFEMEPKDVNERLVQLSSIGIRDRVLASVLAKRPQVLSEDVHEIQALIDNLTSFFPRAKVLVIIRKHPEILFMNFDQLEAAYEYIYYQMGLQPADLLRSQTWHQKSVSEIECRHQFLQRCGAYVTPNVKKAEVAKDNPSLDIILDSNDDEFSRVAGVTKLEWEIFKEIFEDELRASLD